MKSKAQKQLEEQKKVATLIVDIKGGADEFRALAAALEVQADDAARMGRDQYSDDLLATSLELERAAEDLDFTVLQIQTIALTSKVFSKLAAIPGTVKSCLAILKSGPNIAKITDQLRSLRDLQTDALGQVRSMREGLARSSDPTFVSLSASQSDPEYARRLEEKKRAREARLMAAGAVPAAAPAATAAATTSAADDARIDAITKMLDDTRRG